MVLVVGCLVGVMASLVCLIVSYVLSTVLFGVVFDGGFCVFMIWVGLVVLVLRLGVVVCDLVLLVCY